MPVDSRRSVNEKSLKRGKTLPMSTNSTPSKRRASGTRSSLFRTSSASPPAGTLFTPIGPTAFCSKPRSVLLPPA
jgi:hypothetical protein